MARRYTRGPFDPFDQPPFGGIREVQIPRPPRRFWVGLSFIGAALLVIFLTAPIVGFLATVQWFDALGIKGVYLTRVGLETLLFFAGLIIAFLFGTVNILIALRVRSGRALRAVGIRQRTLFSGAGALGLAAITVISLILAGSALSKWQELALFTHSTNTGVREPVYGLDVSFYLLTLPFIHSIVNWFFGLFFLVIVLIGGLSLILAATAFLDRYDLLYSHNGVVWGAGYTDVNARSGIAVIRTVIAGLLALGLFANVVLRRPMIIVAAVATWLVVTILGLIYPAVVQRIVVQPSELSQESPYISREIQATRQAFALTDVQTAPYTGDASLTRKAVDDDQATIKNLRLWDNRQLQDTYQQLQS